ncbi:Putative methyltransferase YodH [Methanococcoides methylutens MM1]|uniref:Putative methyltransferase YodH n=1 Tax=Methanococcoides methylutens MM1 TaxID=1434104 RepID=A0A0E3SS55_METMT|nr:Putative methyltransferase YodH [Methanococcoides methylutens MM1]
MGGLTSTKELAELCQINEESKVLMVGCGAGFSACFVAQNFGCSVVGVDIAEVSIRKANERAKALGLEDKAEFRIGDAYDLPFEADTFDIVITEFVSQFLDTERAYREFVRVLKPGGMVGINEMYSDADMPPEVTEKIREAERIFSEITQLPFSLPSPEDWKSWLEGAGLSDVQVHKHKVSVNLKEFELVAKALGGYGKFARLFISLMIGMTRYTISSRKIRDRFRKLSKGKGILMRNRSTSKHVGYALAVGRK